MDQTRQDRLQQRLRGAQRREIKDVDFGLFLPPPSLAPPPPPPPPPAPEVEQPAPVQPATQPQPDASSQPLRRSPRRSPSQGRTRQPSLNASSGSTSAFDANTSAKRRKLDVEDTAPPSSSRSTRSTQPPPRADVYDIPPDHEEPDISQASVHPTEPSILEQPPVEVEAEVAITDNNVTVQEEESELVFADPSQVEAEPEEVQEAPVDESMVIDEVESVVRITRNKRKHSDEPPEKPSSEPPRRRSARVSDITNITNSPSPPTPTPIPAPQGKKRGRKPRILKESVPAVEEPSAEELQEEADPQEGSKDAEEAEEPEEAEAIDDVEAATQLKKNRSSRRISGGAPEIDAEEAIPSPQAIAAQKPPTKKPRGKQRAAASPEQQRQPKTKASKAQKAETQKRQRLGSPIPVTVHRLTERPQYSDSESDAEILNAEIPYAQRGGVNPIDVLSQFCDEVIASALETFESGIEKADEAALKREYKTKWRAVEEFGRQVQNRLLEHTINLDNNRALGRRVREEKRTKLALRSQILEVRSQREKVALRMDEIRIKHEEEKAHFDKRNTLNRSLDDIELALERGKTSTLEPGGEDVQMDGIEVLMKRIAAEVSSASPEGGILSRVKEFNAFLERAAAALES